MAQDQQYLPIGTSLYKGIYVINKVLSKGGFGITYLAKRTDDKSNVVIKEYYKREWHIRDIHSSQITINSESSDIEGKFRKKFKKEAETIMRLEHPNIVKVFDFFEENGTLYYSMEYIDGVSVSDYVKTRGKFNEEQGLELIRVIANTLGYIHDNNELHLDITPRNIMIKKNLQVVLIDFGVSKHYNEDGKQSTTTPVAHSDGYAPKEQYLSDGMIKFSPATDVYALAATFFFMLTGVTPPNANDRQHFLEEGRDLLQIPQTLSIKVKSAIEMGMCITRKDRIQTTKEFLDALDGIISPREIVATEIDFGLSEAEKNIIESLKNNGQYKDAYNYCIDLIQQGKDNDFIQDECNKLIPLIAKDTKKDQRSTRILIIIIITISIISLLTSIILSNLS